MERLNGHVRVEWRCWGCDRGCFWVLGLEYAGGSAEKGFFKLGIVGLKEKSWNQELDKEAIGKSRGAKKPPIPVKSLCVSVQWITRACACVCVCARIRICVCECVCACVSMKQLQATSLVHNKASHLVHDSFNRHVPLMLCCRRRCIITRKIKNRLPYSLIVLAWHQHYDCDSH